MQIKPVSTVPENLDNLFQNFFKVSSNWSVLNESVQTISDRNNIFGTMLDGYGTDWIGCPLIVHRRCTEPMFSIANKIAYNNIMVYATKSSPTNLDNFLKSSWIDVESLIFRQHWSDEEGEAVISLLTKITKLNDNLPSLFIISPFKDVANQIKKRLQENIKIWKPSQIAYDKARFWINTSVGTIHTFQGKEAEIVIILLGGNPKKYGGIEWVSSEPNMLNVALTRAKNFVFVVGNYDTWSKLPYFQELSDYLPRIEL